MFLVIQSDTLFFSLQEEKNLISQGTSKYLKILNDRQNICFNTAI